MFLTFLRKDIFQKYILIGGSGEKGRIFDFSTFFFDHEMNVLENTQVRIFPYVKKEINLDRGLNIDNSELYFPARDL